MKPALFEVYVFWTRTGEVVDQLGYLSWSYNDSVSWANLGSMSVTVPLQGKTGEGVLNRTSLKSIASGMSSFSLCLVRNGRALFAGPVYTLNWTATAVTLGCASIAKLMDSRILIANSYWGDPTNPAGNLSFALSPHDLVIELLQQGSTGYRRDLPLVFPSMDGAGGTAVSYIGSDLGTVMERVKETSDRDNGPDVFIRAQIDTDKTLVQWLVEIGNPMLGSRESAATWDYGNAISEISGDIDASEMVSTGYVVGDTTGSGDEPRLIGVHVVDRGDPLPALERADRTSVSSKDQRVLNSWAKSYVEGFSFPTQSYSISILPEKWPLLGEEWGLGDTVTFDIRDHPWLEDGEILRRVVGIDHNLDKMVIQTTEAP